MYGFTNCLPLTITLRVQMKDELYFLYMRRVPRGMDTPYAIPPQLMTLPAGNASLSQGGIPRKQSFDMQTPLHWDPSNPVDTHEAH